MMNLSKKHSLAANRQIQSIIQHNLLKLIMLKWKFNSLQLLIGLNVLMFILPTAVTLLLGNAGSVYNALLFLLGGLRTDLVIIYGQWWRVVMSTFLHADVLHILANMFSLYQIGIIVFRFYGGKFMFVFYMLSGIAGSLLSVLFLGNVATVGASGAVFGLIGVLVGGAWRKHRYGMDLPFSMRDVFPIAAYAFVVGLIPGFAVNNWAHLGGFVMGVILGVLIPHKLMSSPWHKGENIAWWCCIILTVVSFVAMVVFAIQTLYITQF